MAEAYRPDPPSPMHVCKHFFFWALKVDEARERKQICDFRLFRLHANKSKAAKDHGKKFRTKLVASFSGMVHYKHEGAFQRNETFYKCIKSRILTVTPCVPHDLKLIFTGYLQMAFTSPFWRDSLLDFWNFGHTSSNNKQKCGQLNKFGHLRTENWTCQFWL